MVVDKSLAFTKQMKKATQEIHDLSDALINAKLGIGMYILENQECSRLNPVVCILIRIDYIIYQVQDIQYSLLNN